MNNPATGEVEMSGSQLRVGVAGLGKMGLLHTSIFNSLPETLVVAATEPSRMVRESLSTHLPEIRLFDNLDRMLSEGSLDALVIATPVDNHVPAALASMERGVPFFVEKPLAVSTDQASELVGALSGNPVTNMVGFMTRFIDSFTRGKEVVASGCLGSLQRVSASIYVSQLFRKGKGWRYERKVSGGGVLLSQGVHVLDLLTWYFGPIARVNADVQSVYSAEVEDFAHLMVTFESGLHGWMDSSWSVRFHRTVETTIDVLGSNGSLVVNDDTVNLYLDEAKEGWPSGRTILRGSDLYRGVPFDVGGPQYTREDQSFARAVHSGKRVDPDVHQAFHLQKVVEAAYVSAAQRGVSQEIT